MSNIIRWHKKRDTGAVWGEAKKLNWPTGITGRLERGGGLRNSFAWVDGKSRGERTANKLLSASREENSLRLHARQVCEYLTFKFVLCLSFSFHLMLVVEGRGRTSQTVKSLWWSLVIPGPKMLVFLHQPLNHGEHCSRKVLSLLHSVVADGIRPFWIHSLSASEWVSEQFILNYRFHHSGKKGSFFQIFVLNFLSFSSSSSSSGSEFLLCVSLIGKNFQTSKWKFASTHFLVLIHPSQVLPLEWQKFAQVWSGVQVRVNEQEVDDEIECKWSCYSWSLVMMMVNGTRGREEWSPRNVIWLKTHLSAVTDIHWQPFEFGWGITITIACSLRPPANQWTLDND